MTDKFKKRVREHATKHGMSYQAALQQLETPLRLAKGDHLALEWEEAAGEQFADGSGSVSLGDITAFRKGCEYAWKQASVDQREKLLEKLEGEVDQLNTQLAGCSVAAFGHGKGNNDAKPGDWGHSVAYDDVKNLRNRHEAALGLIGVLWKLLDDIDTVGDWAKDNDVAFRKNVEKIQVKRWETGVVIDGHRLFIRDWPKNRKQVEWLEKYDPASFPDKLHGVLDGIGPEIFADAPETPPDPLVGLECPECGPVTKCDEDGCCVMCGVDLFFDEDGNPTNPLP